MAKVTEELMNEFHRANEHFAEIRKRLEQASETDSTHREQLANDLRAAEKEVENVSDRISAMMKE